MTTPTLHFSIITSVPIYEASFSQLPGTSPPSSLASLRSLLLYSSLDLVNLSKWTTSSMNLKVIDTSSEGVISAFVTASNATFLLLHEGRTDDSIKNFFNDVYEVYTRYILNPLVERDKVISSKGFDTKVRAISRKHLS